MELHTPQAYLEVAQKLQLEGDLAEAFRYVQKALDLQPHLAEAYVEMGKILDANEQLDDAMSCYEAALRLAPGLWEARWRLGQVYDRKGLGELALASYQRVMAEVPERFPPEEHLKLAQAFFDRQNLQAVMDCASLVSHLAEAWRLMARATMGQGDISRARQCLQQSQERDRAINLAAEYTQLAKACLRQGQLGMAEEASHQAITMEPTFVEAHFTLALTAGQQGKLREAFLGFHELLSLDSGYAPAYYELGMLACRLEKWEEAQAFFAAARALNAYIYPQAQVYIDQVALKWPKPPEA